MRVKWRDSIGLERVVTAGCGFMALAGLVAALFSPAEQSVTLIANVVLTGFLLGLYWLLEKSGSHRPMKIFGIILLVATLQPIALIASTILEGDVVYATQLGEFSHHVDSVHVVAAYITFYGVAGGVVWLIAKTSTSRDCPGWIELSAGITPQQLLLMQWFAVAAALLRVAVMFPDSIGTVPAYFARLFATYFGAMSFFVGVGLRRHRDRASIASAVVLVLLYGLVLLGGNRGDSLLPALFAVAGYVVSGSSPSWRLYATLGAAALLGTAAMFVGAVLRQDEEGRSGDAALGRLESVSERLSEVDAAEGMQGTVLRRMLRNSTHAVLTMVPERFPFDREGVTSLPEEFRRNVLPGFHFEGQAKGKESRNWMLNELGFMVNWRTSVELAVVPDAWARSGWFGIIVVALLLGCMVQLFEEALYAVLGKGYLAQVLLITFSTAAPMAEGKDVVWGFRSLLWTFLAGWMALAVVRALSTGMRQATRRSAVSWRAR